jgi:DNA topoisomerase-1
MKLIITESPAKAKKIQGFLSKEYIVKSSIGHIRGLDTKWANSEININRDFEPQFVVLKDKRDVIQSLKSSSKNNEVILAADDDREGEAIAWHCGIVLNVDFNKFNRIKYREISKKAIVNALENPIKVNLNEVNAQKARSVIDLLIGYKLSPCLWKHIDTNVKGLSAGRVQSALLNLLYEHDKKIKDFESEYYYEILGDFVGLENSEYIFKKNFNDDVDEDFIKKLFKLFSIDRKFIVNKNTIKQEKNYPDKPLITSTLQQTAQNTYGFNVSKTMQIAQKLYENGKITYMRTDSTFISDEFKQELFRFINDKFGEDIYNDSKSKKVLGAQEAHEAIRPTNLKNVLSDGYSEDEKKLYNLILKRTITSHMKPAIYDVNTIELQNTNTNKIGCFTSKDKLLVYKGYLLYDNNNENNEKKQFKKEYDLVTCSCFDKCNNPPQPYNESGVVKLLERTGIGRPSTYSNIISTLYTRSYTKTENIKFDDSEIDVIYLDKKNKILDKKKKVKGQLLKNKIMITELGQKVLEYLNKNFYDIIQKDYTVLIENDLDRITKGELVWQDVVKNVYDSFIHIVITQIGDKTYNKNKNKNKIIGQIKNNDVSLGNGKYGNFILYKKKFTNIDSYLKIINKSLDDINLVDCKDILKYPKKIGENDDKDILIYLGQYGKYLKYNNRNYRIANMNNYTLEYCLGVIR